MEAGAREHLEVSPMSTIAAAGYGVARPRRTGGAPVVRLTRRGRLVLFVLLLGAIFVALTVLSDQSAATADAGTPVHTRTVVVGEGDTLWGIASEIAEPGETREMIHHIQELNALPSVSLMRGQELAVPVG
jgi:hypothetical protein